MWSDPERMVNRLQSDRITYHMEHETNSKNQGIAFGSESSLEEGSVRVSLPG